MADLVTSTVADLVRNWPSLVSVSDDDVLTWQDWAEAIAGTPFGTMRARAVSLLIAHLLMRLDEDTSPGGEVTSLKTLSLAASFAPSGETLSDAEFATTRPGRTYLVLRRATAAVVVPRIILPQWRR